MRTPIKTFVIGLGIAAVTLLAMALSHSDEESELVRAPTPATQAGVPSAYTKITEHYGMPPYPYDPERPFQISDDIINAVIHIESRGDPKAVGKAGERGLMQIMPDTWEDTCQSTFGRSISFDRAFEPELNIRVGTAFLEQIASRHLEREDEWRSPFLNLLLASYNAGFGAVSRAKFDTGKLPDSVQTYVERGTTAAHALKEFDLVQAGQSAKTSTQTAAP